MFSYLYPVPSVASMVPLVNGQITRTSCSKGRNAVMGRSPRARATTTTPQAVPAYNRGSPGELLCDCTAIAVTWQCDARGPQRTRLSTCYKKKNKRTR